jgi:hypothetical protein
VYLPSDLEYAIEVALLKRPKVLAITKRPAELCATQPWLNAAGLELITATNMDAAGAIIQSTRVKGIIVCKGSWSKGEREAIAAELWMLNPDVAVILRCPGCTGCDEVNRSAGTLQDTLPLTKFIAAIASI